MVLGNISCDLDPKVNQGQGQILNSLVNASPAKTFDVVTSKMYFLVNAFSP